MYTDVEQTPESGAGQSNAEEQTRDSAGLTRSGAGQTRGDAGQTRGDAGQTQSDAGQTRGRRKVARDRREVARSIDADRRKGYDFHVCYDTGCGVKPASMHMLGTV